MSGYNRGPAKSASLPLQKAIYARLSSDPALKILVSGVYDEVPDGAKMPYVHIGDETTNPYDTKTNYGEDATITLHVFSLGPGKVQAKTIMNVVLQSMTATPLVISGFVVEGVEKDFMEVFHDGSSYHGIVRFRVFTKQL